jgi:hypothetical protein
LRCFFSPDRLTTTWVRPALAVCMLVTVVGGFAQPPAVPAVPSITSLAPSAGRSGTLVTIHGSNLVQVTHITFNGVAAPIYGSSGDGTAIQTEVPAEATTGRVRVANSAGEAESPVDFEVVPIGPPFIERFTPEAGPVGRSVSLVGSNLVNITSVTFNGAPALFSRVEQFVEAIVPTNATTGPIVITTAQGSFTTPHVFTVVGGGPVLRSFSPTSGPPGTVITINGTNLLAVKEVLFGDIATGVAMHAGDTSLMVVVPRGAKSGPLTLVSDSGQTTSIEPFTVMEIPAPVITGFAPTAAAVRSTVTISGQHLRDVRSVSVSGVPAEFTPFFTEQLLLTVPYAPSGPITVITDWGSATSTASLTIIGGQPPAALLGFEPNMGVGGSTVILQGTNLIPVRAVLFNGVPAAYEQYGNVVLAWVPPLATAGLITIQTDAGPVTSAEPFVTFNSGHLGVLTSASRHPLILGGKVTFTVTLTNLTAAPIGDVIVTNTFAFAEGDPGELLAWTNNTPAFAENALPADIRIGAVQASQGTYTLTNSVLVWSPGPVGPSDVPVLTIEAEPLAAHQLNLLVWATAGPRPDGEDIYGTALEPVIVTESVELSVRHTADGQVAVSWPILDLPLTLQSADGVGSAAVWQDVAITPTVVDGRNLVLIPASSTRQFYRLITPPPAAPPTHLSF